MRLHRAVVQGLLCVDPAEALRRDNERLRGSRAAALELEASELRRIERDLHDGAQQRLVSLAIDLGRAEERIDTDPAAAKAIVVDAPRAGAARARRAARPRPRDDARDPRRPRARGRAVVRRRGQPGADRRRSARCRPASGCPPAIERAAYFVVVEALANVAKHSEATPLRGGAAQGPVGAGRSRCATTAPAARRSRRAAGWRGCATGRRRWTGRWRSRARPAARPSSASSCRSPRGAEPAALG